LGLVFFVDEDPTVVKAPPSSVFFCRLIRNWVKKAQLKKTSKAGLEGSDEEDENENTTTAPLRLEDFEVIVGRLMLVSEELASLFRRTFSLHATTGTRMKRLYGILFEQVAAEEYALQMINARSVQSLYEFTMDPCWGKASKLIDIPALYNVLEAEYKSNGQYPRDLVQVSAWICSRARMVLDGLSKAEPVSIPQEEYLVVEDWRKTGTCYSFPKIREHPTYPGLSGDGTADKLNKAEWGGKCTKYYSTYGEKRLTGGIMAVWCTHSVCYGSHCIPKAEGRNDVFSAMYTRLPKAPQRVVYDFACALGPYFMARKPEFFKHTQFFID
ncbi:hypothetical protein V5O48_018219, partial [Marasmius crinis-equi]